MPKSNEKIPIYEDGHVGNTKYYSTTIPSIHTRGCDITLYGDYKLIQYPFEDDSHVGVDIVNCKGETIATIWGYKLHRSPEFTIKLRGDFSILELQKIMGSLAKTEEVSVIREG